MTWAAVVQAQPGLVVEFGGDRAESRFATLPWMRTGTAHLLAVVDKLPLVDKLGDEGLRGPGALPGWIRAHVVGYVARNTEALARLTTWAHASIQTQMSADREQRGRDRAVRGAARRRAPRVAG